MALEIGHSEDNSHDHAQRAPQSLNQDPPKGSDLRIHWYLAVHFPWETAKKITKVIFSHGNKAKHILYKELRRICSRKIYLTRKPTHPKRIMRYLIMKE